jgi:predicted lipoprotein with Yx(FWY)xxD motif
MFRRSTPLIAFTAVAILVAACGGTGTTTTSGPVTTTTQATTGATSGNGDDLGPTVNAQAVGSAGTILVAASNGMTLYNFTKDVKDSGTSACTGNCLATWPPLTVPQGQAPIAGEGVTGKLGTITRTDDGSIQVTYNGLPLYFFKNDKAPGDLNGVYENWVTVAP